MSSILFGPFNATANDPELTEGETIAARPRVTALDSGVMFVAYASAESRAVRIGQSFDGGHTFPDPGVVAHDHDARLFVPSHVVEGDSSLHVVWSSRNFPTYRVRSRQLGTDGSPLGSSSQVNSEPDTTRGGNEITFPKLVHGGDALVCAWHERLENPVELLIRSATSTDGGIAWSQVTVSREATASPLRAGPALGASDSGIFYLAAVEDAVDGRTLRLYRKVGTTSAWQRMTDPPTTLEVEGTPSLAVAPAGTIGLIANLHENPGAPPSSLWFWQSTDLGQSWSKPVRVSPTEQGRNHYDPALAVDQDGIWHAAWITNRPFELQIDALHARSFDGADWSGAKRVNRVPHTVAPWTPGSIDVTTDPEGHVYIVYHYREQSATLALHLMTSREHPVGYVPPVVHVAARTSPNPFQTSVNYTLRAPIEGQVDVAVFDVGGRRIRQWSNVVAGPEARTLTWNGKLPDGGGAPPGLYFWRVVPRGGARTEGGEAKSVKLAD